MLKIKIITIIVGLFLLGSGVVIIWQQASVPRNSQQQAPDSHGKTAQAPAIQLNIDGDNAGILRSDTPLRVGIKTTNYAALDHVEYRLDEIVVATSKTAPFEVNINLERLAAGTHTLQAYGYISSGAYSKSERFNFTVDTSGVMTPSDGGSQAIVRQAMQSSQLASAVGNEQGSDNSTPPGSTAPWPTTPPAQICGVASILDGPATPPAGAITVSAGDNSAVDFSQAGVTYWFASGTHTLGTGQFSQIGPGNNATFTGAPGAIIDGQHINQYAFTGTATGVTIQHLTIKNFEAPRDEGVVNHDSGSGWTMQYITAQDNGGGAVFLGSNNILRYSCLKDNGQYGFQVYNSSPAGPSNVLLDHSEISGNNTDDWETQVSGCGCTGGGKFWNAHNVTVTNSYVHDNLSTGLWADTNDSDFLVEGNYIANNEGQGLFYEISYNMIVRNNNFVGNAQVAGAANNGFPISAIYLSESGGDNRVAGRTANIDIYDNNFSNNWAGVVLWENADRFCGSPANTSTGYCTIVNPAADLTTCNDPGAGGSIDQPPYTSDCRWKTQNVKVHDNTFAIDKSAISGCITTASCGLQGIFSNSGTSPNWSPYMGSIVANDITFNQNNTFSNNTYIGDWNFMIRDQSHTVNYALWQAAPYNQDVGSMLNGQPRLIISNYFDANTSGFENGLGLWNNWFNAPISQTTDEAHSGTHSLKVAVGDQFWGINFSQAGPIVSLTGKTFSFWAKQTVGSSHFTARVQWLNASGGVISTSDLTAASFTSNWQKYSLDSTPPSGTDKVYLDISSGDSAIGNIVYFDDFVLEDTQ